MSTQNAKNALKTQFAGTNAGKTIATLATSRANALSSMSVHSKKTLASSSPSTGNAK